jgi:hypothetical protein
MLNFAVGIMFEAIPAFKDDPSTSGGLIYDADFSGNFVTGLNGTISPSGELEDKGDAIYRVLDTIGLGFIKRWVDTVTQYTHGFVKLLELVLGPHLNDGLVAILFTGLGGQSGILYSLVTIGYIVGAWILWTGKSIN